MSGAIFPLPRRRVDRDTFVPYADPPMAPILTAESGLLQAPGQPELWLWARTCPERGCECRTALVLASWKGREALLEAAAPSTPPGQSRGPRLEALFPTLRRVAPASAGNKIGRNDPCPCGSGKKHDKGCGAK